MVVQLGAPPMGWPLNLTREDKLGTQDPRHALDLTLPSLKRPARRDARRRFTLSVPSKPAKPLELTFPLRPRASAIPGAFKRRRHRLDVDGPNTAALACKKRRLRNDLITSRLSQPYSQPATHILNREGMESGDKRFLKMATSIEMARRLVHLHSTSFLRFSVMNRLRRRLGLGAPGTGFREAATRMDPTDRAPWTPATPSTPALSPVSLPSPAASPSTPARTSTSPPSKPPSIRVSKPAALPLPSADMAKDRQRVRIDATPRSPELRPLPPVSAYEELDEDNFSFLHADDESAGDDDEGDGQVYSDFGVIFGGAGEKAEDDDGSYEEYLDELDGISWVTR